jgi:Ca2+/H+ antiporter
VEEKASLLIIFMIPHLLIAGNCLFSQIRCKVKTFSTISSINSQKLLLFAANLSFLLTFLQEYAEKWRKIVAITFGSSKEECKHPHKKYQEISPWIATFHRSSH